MTVVVTAEARAFRRAVGLTAWAVLEELVLDAEIDEDGAVVARTNVRRLAAQLGISKDTAARAVARLTHAEVVARIVGGRGEHGALPTSRYAIELNAIPGMSTSNCRDAVTTRERRRAPRTTHRIDDAQAALFDLPTDAS